MAGVYLLACFQTLIAIQEQRQCGTVTAWISQPLPRTKQALQKWGPKRDPVTSVCFAVFQDFVFKTPLGGRKVPSVPCQRHRKI